MKRNFDIIGVAKEPQFGLMRLQSNDTEKFQNI